MYFSRLTINKRNKYAIKDFNNIQDLHVTISKAFPEICGEKSFFKKNKILFRIENKNDYPVILIQSEKKPNWEHLNNGYLINKPECIENVEYKYDQIKKNNVFNFRIRINAAKKNNNNKRIPIIGIDNQINWFKSCSNRNGFETSKISLINENPINIYKKDYKITYNSVIFEGTLKVVDSIRFINCLKNGIGQGKSYGFGMLSIRN